MSEGMKAIIYPVKDLAQAETLYSSLLGVDPSMDEAYYVGFRIGSLDVGLDPHGHSQGMTGPVAYWEVDDIEKSLTSLLTAGQKHSKTSGTLAGAS